MAARETTDWRDGAAMTVLFGAAGIISLMGAMGLTGLCTKRTLLRRRIRARGLRRSLLTETARFIGSLSRGCKGTGRVRRSPRRSGILRRLLGVGATIALAVRLVRTAFLADLEMIFWAGMGA